MDEWLLSSSLNALKANEDWLTVLVVFDAFDVFDMFDVFDVFDVLAVSGKAHVPVMFSQ